VYLVGKHFSQTVSGSLLLSESAESRIDGGRHHGEFLGVGDPTYNQVDSRWLAGILRPTAQLQRLVGSRDEIESSAESWIKGGGEGRRSRFLRRLESRPAAVHLATHVLCPSPSREEGLIAFGPGDSRAAAAEPEFITTSQIAGLRVPGALVVMTGSATGTGEAHDSAGLLGLTRAWPMAGASTVISTAWRVEKNSGAPCWRVFIIIYENHSAAEAPQLSQREVSHSRTGRLAPASWATYQVTGGTH
jgi:hypothetical protein